MSNTIGESLIVGIITMLIGMLTLKFISKEHGSINYETSMFFIIGFFIHNITEYIGFNKFYCNKKCRKSLKLLNS